MNKPEYSLLDTLFEAAIIVDQEANILYFNHHFSTLSKSSPRQIQKKQNLFKIFNYPEDQIKKIIFAAKTAQAPQLSAEQEIFLSDHPKESCIFITKVTPVNNDQYLICFNDMTIENRLYEKYKSQFKELEKTHNQIIQADKLSTIGEMTANISHEISNPLTIASGNIEIIETLLNTPLKKDEQDILISCVADIKDSHQRINNIINNMKTFLHQSGSHREYTDLNILIEKTIKFLGPKLEDANIEIEITKESFETIGLVDAGQIEQVFINLIKNSIDAYKGHPGKIKINIQKDHHLNTITFSDTGPGIKETDRNKIFEAFYTTKKIGEGTGLGLAISQKILKAHKGELILLDTKEAGAHFQIRLPSIEVMSYTQNEFHYGRSNSTNLKRVLIVDDEMQILNIMNKIISDEGMVFIGSANPQDALDMIDELPLDLIIVDYLMPQMNGDEFSKKVREINQTVPILYLSSIDNQDKYAKDRKELGLCGMIIKPFTKETMLSAIHHGLKLGET